MATLKTGNDNIFLLLSIANVISSTVAKQLEVEVWPIYHSPSPLLIPLPPSARVDGLSKRVITPTEMIEHYVDRVDFLYHRHVTYEKLPKKHSEIDKSKPRQILKVVEKFHPNPAVPANSDAAEMTILLVENHIKVVCQLEGGRNTASNREFIVPPMNPDQALMLTFDPDGISTYQVCIANVYIRTKELC